MLDGPRSAVQDNENEEIHAEFAILEANNRDVMVCSKREITALVQ